MKKIVLTIENMDSTLAALKRLGIDREADTLTRKDLVTLTSAGVQWDLPADEVPMGDRVKSQNAATTPGTHRDTIRDERPLDLKNDADFTDPNVDYDDWNTKTQIDNFSSTAVVSRVANKLAAKLSSAEYRSMTPDELKAAIEATLKSYIK